MLPYYPASIVLEPPQNRVGMNSNTRIAQWEPPPRPDWVRRVNEEGRYLDIKAVVPLDENSLLAAAMKNTGLSDFGGEDWREPFRVFVKALDEEADLNLMGRLMTRSDILMHLEARLRIEQTYKDHPEIDAQELAPPILIVGSGRCGSSAIQNLLSLDPDNSSPRHWEALFPTPPPEKDTYFSDPRIGVTDARMDQWNRVTPELLSVHEFRGHMPTELLQIEAISFQNSGWLDLYGVAPSFNAYLAPRGFVPSMTYAKRVLKLLQWRNRRKRWILKSPDAMRSLADVFKVFPDIRLVWMHRDPLKAVASAVSLVGTLCWIRSDKPLNEQMIQSITNPVNLSNTFNRILDQIDSGEIPGERIHHIKYPDFIADPIGTIESLYKDLGVSLSAPARSAMEEFLKKSPREARPAHKYGLGDSDQVSRERELFARYQNRFGIESEL
jgi:hypothetical protein